jgi:hypothetical protein
MHRAIVLRVQNAAQNLSDNQDLLASAVIEFGFNRARLYGSARESLGQLMRRETPPG